jgi:hypothetical protein
MAAMPSKQRSKPANKGARGRRKPERRAPAGPKHAKKNVRKRAAATKATTGRAAGKKTPTGLMVAL